METQREISQKLSGMQNTIDGLQASIQSLDKNAKDLSVQQKVTAQEKKSKTRALLAMLSLYRNISGIQWDYDSKNIKGSVHLSGATVDVRLFDFPPAPEPKVIWVTEGQSETETEAETQKQTHTAEKQANVQRLWDLMWSDEYDQTEEPLH